MNSLRALAFMLLFACSTGKHESSEPLSSGFDSASRQNIPFDTLVYEPTVYAEDSTMFIGFIEYHAKTNELFVPLYHRVDNADETFYKVLRLEHDSVIVNDDELTRTRLKAEVARKYFNLAGLERITVFNNAGRRLGDATLTRVEHLDEMIEGSYTAVFKPEMKLGGENEAHYCISKGKTSFTQHLWDWHVKADANLDRGLMKTFELDSQQVLKIRHVHFDDLNATYSTVSLQDNVSSMLVETKAGVSTSLMTVEKGYSLGDLHPVHFNAYGHPVFLCNIMPNETDGSFDILLAFNGEKYVMLPWSRTH
jgi:hypothetical protein